MCRTKSATLAVPQSSSPALIAGRSAPHAHRQAHLAPAQSALARNSDSRRGGGPISQLQEYVQSDRRFPAASNRPILQWEIDQRMANPVTLEFRATVSFVLEGVPHHACGSWLSSKKEAQRDAAERVMSLLHDQWPSFEIGGKPVAAVADMPFALEAEKFSAFCEKLGHSLNWHLSTNPEGIQCRVDVILFNGVTHTLQGSTCASELDAREDLAMRALWYFQCPGYEDVFEVCAEEAASEQVSVPSQSEWRREGRGLASDAPSEAKQRAANEKTQVMRMQNRLQRAYGKQLSPGTSVWTWHYENSHESSWCRAHVHVAVLNQTFVGEWCAGQKRAQIDACARLAQFLDQQASSAIGEAC